ncbi:hypothetical protein ACQHIV_34835 [Kribbella sp. GL6]|uniref:hypothetical protein n=1 Tax=Kribbella sp. GL6 TaxID=3419765 RepID=UPI003D08697A
MTHIRAASWSGSAAKPNEDAYITLPGLVAVADGATAPPTLGTGCIHDPRWYSRQLVGNLACAYLAGPADDLVGLLADAIKSTALSHAGSCDPAHPGTPSATVAILRYDDASLDWLVLSDATIVLQSGAALRVECDDRLFNSSVEARNAVLATDLRDDGRAAKVALLVDQQRGYRNTAGGFWVAASDPTAASHALRGSERVIAGSPWRAALLTDGASAAVDTYNLSDWQGLLDDLESSGPSDLLRVIRRVEADDPGAVTYPRIKRSDDATAVFVSGEGQ